MFKVVKTGPHLHVLKQSSSQTDSYLTILNADI